MSTIQFSKRHDENRFGRVFMMVMGGLFMVIIFALIFGFLLKLLWNATIVELFGLPAITYWQAIGLFILAKFLFGFGFGGQHHHYNDRKKQHERWKEWCSSKPEGTSEQNDDEMLQKYWQEEGRQAYDAYLAARKEGRSDWPDE